MSGRTKASIVSVGIVLAALLAGGSCAVAQSGGRSGEEEKTARGDPARSNNPTTAFRYYFSVTTDPRERRKGNNWSDDLRFETDVLSRDYVILYQHLTGLYPKAGPHLAQDPAYMRAHLEKLAVDVTEAIPDPAFSGVAILDYEVFRAIWDRTPNKPSTAGPEALDEDFQDDWRDHIRSVNPRFGSMSAGEQEQHLRETYEAGVRDLFLGTLAKCRELRPHAKWGFYGYPIRFYEMRREAPAGVKAYGDGSHRGSQLNDRLQWMWDAVDVISPSLYAPRVIVGPGENVCEDQCTAVEDWEFMQGMMLESERVANGKPVLPFIGVRYNTPRDCLRGQDINEANLHSQVFAPAELGAEGAILWGDINTRAELVHWQSLLDKRIMPKMRRAVAERRARDGGTGPG